MKPLADTDLLEMVELLAEALAVVWCELAQLEDTPIPLPEEMRKALQERDALAATLKTLPEATRKSLHATYRAQLARAHRDPELKVPILPEVFARLDASYEVLRRRAIAVPELREAVRRLGP